MYNFFILFIVLGNNVVLCNDLYGLYFMLFIIFLKIIIILMKIIIKSVFD